MDESWLASAFDAALRIDEQAERDAVAGLRRAHPDASSRELAEIAIQGTRRWGAGLGAATGMVTVPWAAPVGGAIDTAGIFRLEVKLAARIAEIYEPGFLSREGANYELLAPIFGAEAVNEFMEVLAAPKLTRLTRKAVVHYLTRKRQGSFRSVMLRYLGRKVAARSLGKLFPIVGSVVAASWYYAELGRAGKRVCEYFESSSGE